MRILKINKLKITAFIIFSLVLISVPNVVLGALSNLEVVEFAPTTIKGVSGDKIEVVIKGEYGVGDDVPNVISGSTLKENSNENSNAITKETNLNLIYKEPFQDGQIAVYKGIFVLNNNFSTDLSALSVVVGSTTSKTFSVKVDQETTHQNKPIGNFCSKDSDCMALNLNGQEVQLVCERNRCSAPPAYRAIGVLCNKRAGDSQCKRGDSNGFDFTCGDNNYCVGAVEGVECLNGSQDVNKYILLGKVWPEMDSVERCDTGLVCDPKEGACVNDFGQGKIPADRLGEAASDIRDQIRNLINIALGFLGVAGVIVVIWGGAIWMSAAGDDEKVAKAKKTIISGVIGLVIIGIAWTIISYVLVITKQIS